MNLIILILFFYQNILCKGNFVVVKNVYFLENNFWDFTNQEQSKTDKGYLHRIAVHFENNRGNRFGIMHITSFCHYLSFTNCRYIVLNDKMVDYIDNFKKSTETDHFIINFEFFFTDFIVNHSYLDEYYAKVQSYKTFKMLEKVPDENFLCLKSDCKEIRMHYLKKLFINLSKMRLLKIDEYISAMEEQCSEDKFKIIENTAKFKLNHFKNYSECLESILIFVKDLNHLNSLIDDDVVDSAIYKFSVLSINMESSPKVSRFIDSLRQRFKEKNIKENLNVKNKFTGFISRIIGFFSKSTKPVMDKRSKNLELLFDTCFDHINSEIMNNNVFLPISDKYDIDYYLLMLCNIIQNLVESIIRIYDMNKPQLQDVILRYQIKILDIKLKDLQDMAVKDLCEAKYIHNYFSKLLEKDIKTLNDYKIIENMVCDYNNMLVFLTNITTIKSKFNFPFNYLQPLFIDNSSCRIVDGLLIKFEEHVYLESIKAFNCEDKEIHLKEDTDYFREKVDKSYFFVTEILKLKNICRIEITTYICAFNKKFKVVKFVYV